jgi:thiamine biosynthesis lipoprotein
MAGCGDRPRRDAPAAHDATSAPEPASTADAGSGATIVEARRQLMGTEFQISVADVEEGAARRAITAAFAEIEAVEARLSTHLDDSVISRINAAAGREPVRVDEEILDLLTVARDVSERSGGAFDVTFAALSPVWQTLRESPPRLPADADVEAARALVSFRDLVLDRAAGTVFLRRPGMRMNLGGIGKGHGVDRAAAVLAARGVENFIVGGGGDLLVRGSKRGTPWRLGIQHPRRRDGLLGTITLRDGQSVVTSGDYERFVDVDGRRYHHILDPRTGRPARGAVAVTLIATDATLADAMATAVFVLGPEAGMRLVEATVGVEALIVDEALRITMSPGMRDVVTLLEPEGGAAAR